MDPMGTKSFNRDAPVSAEIRRVAAAASVTTDFWVMRRRR
jgi:hypothetical protein